jgi:hypothetical protein
MENLDEIFNDEEDFHLANQILISVSSSSFEKASVGTPYYHIIDQLARDGHLLEDSKYIRGVMSILVSHGYMDYHPNSTRENPRVCLRN